MTIEEPDFRLTPCGTNSFWDLELLYTIKPKGGEARQEFKNAGYGLTLEGALKRIISYRIQCKYPKAALKFKDYLKEYKEQVSKLDHILDN